MEYKDTLLMPKTDFPMRGSLPTNEPVQREVWEKDDLYRKIISKNKENERFTLHDGPPYANGSIHIGHSMNKILKDFINRSKMLQGYDVEFIPGWDVHGLPIEQAVTNTGINRKTMTKAQFRQLCAEFAEKQIDIQRHQLKSLNILADWENPYVTMQPEFEAEQIKVFAEMTKRGLIFKGLKPVYWSPSSESALAEAEIEYKDKKDPAIYVAFPIVTGNEAATPGETLMIWTTTPWTLPGNFAIAVGTDISYAKVNHNGKIFIVAYDLVTNIFEEGSYTVLSTVMGHELEGITYENKLMNRISPVVIGHHVTTVSGTGMVHIAPSYGVDDFQIGQKYNLGMINGVDDQGVLTEESGEFAGLFYADANKVIGGKLEELEMLYKLEFITHSYPHDWRTKQPIIFRATPQWFCKISPIREELLEKISKEVSWHQEWGMVRLYNMIKDRGDWCISRQRAWGVPIPIFYNEDGSEILDYDIMIHVSNLFREHGSNIWFERTAKELLPEGYTNEKSPNGNFTKEEDIMDVWFDSGSTHTAVLKQRGLPYPADVYLEGSDQYRGWFNSSLITGVSVYGKAPYKKVISHGYVLDGKGQKQSKSLGNVTNPLDVIAKDGADVLRLWVASVDFREDVRFSEEIFNGVRESYRKVRNTYRFMLGNLGDFNPDKDSIAYENMKEYDQYAMIVLNDFVSKVRESYNGYNYQEIYKLVNNFIAVHLSTFYLDFTKDILYIEQENSAKRRSVQTVIYHTLKSLTILLAPILPHTSEEAYQMLPGEKQTSVHLETMPSVETYENKETHDQYWPLFFAVKNDVYKALEEARSEKIIGKSLEAKVMIEATEAYLELLTHLKKDLHQLLIVSEVELTSNTLPKYEVVGVKIELSSGEKCERCWNYVSKGTLKEEICQRCYDVVHNEKN